jgi:hypothetical protein
MASDYRMQADLPRGIRNNNPGNIKDDGTSWQGMAGSDGVFVIFADMAWGVRAMATALVNMIRKGYNTVGTLIPEWSATDQAAYVANVANAMGIAPGDLITTDVPTLSALIRAMITQENGDANSYVSDQDIADGISKMNNTLLTLLQAGVVAADQNPMQTAGILIAVAFGFYLLFRRK